MCTIRLELHKGDGIFRRLEKVKHIEVGTDRLRICIYDVLCYIICVTLSLRSFIRRRPGPVKSSKFPELIWGGPPQPTRDLCIGVLSKRHVLL